MFCNRLKLRLLTESKNSSRSLFIATLRLRLGCKLRLALSLEAAAMSALALLFVTSNYTKLIDKLLLEICTSPLFGNSQLKQLHTDSNTSPDGVSPQASWLDGSVSPHSTTGPTPQLFLPPPVSPNAERSSICSVKSITSTVLVHAYLIYDNTSLLLLNKWNQIRTAKSARLKACCFSCLEKANLCQRYGKQEGVRLRRRFRLSRNQCGEARRWRGSEGSKGSYHLHAFGLRWVPNFSWNGRNRVQYDIPHPQDRESTKLHEACCKCLAQNFV